MKKQLIFILTFAASSNLHTADLSKTSRFIDSSLPLSHSSSELQKPAEPQQDRLSQSRDAWYKLLEQHRELERSIEDGLASSADIAEWQEAEKIIKKETAARRTKNLTWLQSLGAQHKKNTQPSPMSLDPAEPQQAFEAEIKDEPVGSPSKAEKWQEGLEDMDLLSTIPNLTTIRTQTRDHIGRACAAFDSFFDYSKPSATSPLLERPDLDLVSLSRSTNPYLHDNADLMNTTYGQCTDVPAIISHSPELIAQKDYVLPSITQTENRSLSSIDIATMNAFLRKLSPRLATIDLDQLPESDNKKILMSKLPLAITLARTFAQAEEIRSQNSSVHLDEKEWRSWRKAVHKEQNECIMTALVVSTIAQYDTAVAQREDVLEQITAYQASTNYGLDLEMMMVHKTMIENILTDNFCELLEKRNTADANLDTAMKQLCSLNTAQERTVKRIKKHRTLFKKREYPHKPTQVKALSIPALNALLTTLLPEFASVDIAALPDTFSKQCLIRHLKTFHSLRLQLYTEKRFRSDVEKEVTQARIACIHEAKACLAESRSETLHAHRQLLIETLNAAADLSDEEQQSIRTEIQQLDSEIRLASYDHCSSLLESMF